MLGATFTGKYETTGAKAGKGSTKLTFDTNVGDAKLKASVTNSLVLGATDYSPSTFAFSLSKPNSFSIRYSPVKKDGDPLNLRFKFMNYMNVMGRRVNLAYHHAMTEKKTKVKSSVELNDQHKLAVEHVVGSKDGELRYTFKPLQCMVVEPSYKVASREWKVAVSRSFEGSDLLKGTYEPMNRKVGLEWSRTSKERGTFKISGSLLMKDRVTEPQLMAQTTWSYHL